MTVTTLQTAQRWRAYVVVSGQDAAGYLDRMVSNEVETLEVGESCEALLLTPKARVIAPLTVWRRAGDDFLLLTEPAAGARVARELMRARFAAKCRIDPEEHRSLLVVGADSALVLNEHKRLWVANRDYGVPTVELIDADPSDLVDSSVVLERISHDELERLRILARTPRLGHELDDRVLPAEAGLEERAISFTKGCYPGQEPVARLHYRGHPNRGLRVLALEGATPPGYDAELVLEEKVVGRVTSAVPDPDHGVVALAYVRREVPADAILRCEGRTVRHVA